MPVYFLQPDAPPVREQPAPPVREQPLPDNGGEHSLSDKCFLALLWGIILVQIWRHLWVLQLLPILLACLLIKKVGE